MADKATSDPFLVTLPSGTKLFGITQTEYIKDGNTVTPVDSNKGSPVYYYTQVDRNDWRGQNGGGIQYAAPGTGAPKYYNLQGVYNKEGDRKCTTIDAVTELQQEFAKYDAGKTTQISTVVATSPKAVAKSAGVPESGLSQKLFNPIVAGGSGGGGGGGGGSGDDADSPTDVGSVALPKEIDLVKTDEFGTLLYPEKIQNNGQDFIKFEVFEYISQKLSSNNLLFEPRGEYKDTKDTKDEKRSRGTIILPIQPTVMDTNTVSWGDSKLGILEMMGANLSLSGMNATANYMNDMANKFGQTIASQDGSNKIAPEIVTAVQNYLAKMAISSNTNLLSRTGGAVTNPNLTLLFDSPDLRNFSFNFKLTPRTEKEGTTVRKIIRVFKQYMAVQRSAGNLFLETPNVFNITYIRGDDIKTKKTSTHKSLNLFKTCALRNFSVNYTPSNTYMTYDDVAGTMSSYDLTMSFTELDPVYYDDYTSVAEDSIGY